jgi:hypothetical protein
MHEVVTAKGIVQSFVGFVIGSAPSDWGTGGGSSAFFSPFLAILSLLWAAGATTSLGSVWEGGEGGGGQILVFPGSIQELKVEELVE